mgnify:CR=1 FL=1
MKLEKEEKAVHANSIREIFYTFLNRFIMKNLYLILVLSALVACTGSSQKVEAGMCKYSCRAVHRIACF